MFFPNATIDVKEGGVIIGQVDEQIAVTTLFFEASYGDGVGDVIAPATIATTVYVWDDGVYVPGSKYDYSGDAEMEMN